jgi:hypothetical protein
MMHYHFFVKVSITSNKNGAEGTVAGIYRACKDAATGTRYQAVRLYGEGYPEKEIEQITGCSRTSLMEWCRAYREDHSQGLVDKRLHILMTA